jgi:hypothetical protein
VDVTFSTKKYSGAVRKSVHVVSSDANRPSFPLQVSALVGGSPATLGLNPESGIDFDRFPVDERQEASVALTNYSPETMHVSIIGAPPEFLSASLSSDVIEPRASVDLMVKTLDKPPLGKFTGAITLRLDQTGNTRVTIPISGVSMMR